MTILFKGILNEYSMALFTLHIFLIYCSYLSVNF